MVSDSEPPLTPHEHKAWVFKFVAELSDKTGVDLDPEKVWKELVQKGAADV